MDKTCLVDAVETFDKTWKAVEQTQLVVEGELSLSCRKVVS